MRKAKLLTIWIMLLLASSSGAQTILHRISVNVQLNAGNSIVTEVRDITPGGVDEGFVPIDDRHLMKKFILNVSFGSDNYFQRLDWWKSSMSAQEKQGKCGRKWIDDRHAHYCWGIDPVHRRKYFVSYPLKNLLYNDGRNDVLDYDFVDLTGQTPAEVAEVKLSLKEGQLTENDLDLQQSSAYLDIRLSDGMVIVKPKNAGSVANMPLHLAFRSGLFDGIERRIVGENMTADTSAVAGVDSGMRHGLVITKNFSWSKEELESQMMKDNTPKTESAEFVLSEYFYAYPKTFLSLGCLLVILLGVIYRYIRILFLRKKS